MKIKKKDNNVLKVANNIQNFCKSIGFVIQRYDATTGSIYLKLDYGVCHSIRISNHYSPKNLSYRYNVILGEEPFGYFIDKNGYERLFYNESELEALYKQIVKDKQNLLAKYGLNNYKKYMELNKKEKSKKKGFWQYAKLV